MLWILFLFIQAVQRSHRASDSPIQFEAIRGCDEVKAAGAAAELQVQMGCDAFRPKKGSAIRSFRT